MDEWIYATEARKHESIYIICWFPSLRWIHLCIHCQWELVFVVRQRVQEIRPTSFVKLEFRFFRVQEKFFIPIETAFESLYIIVDAGIHRLVVDPSYEEGKVCYYQRHFVRTAISRHKLCTFVDAAASSENTQNQTCFRDSRTSLNVIPMVSLSSLKGIIKLFFTNGLAGLLLNLLSLITNSYEEYCVHQSTRTTMN